MDFQRNIVYIFLVFKKVNQDETSRDLILIETGVVLRLSLNIVGDDESNSPHKLLLTNRQVENLRQDFANKSSTDIKLSKTRLSKMIQLGGFLGRLLGPFTKNRITIDKKYN